MTKVWLVKGRLLYRTAALVESSSYVAEKRVPPAHVAADTFDDAVTAFRRFGVAILPGGGSEPKVEVFSVVPVEGMVVIVAGEVGP